MAQTNVEIITEAKIQNGFNPEEEMYTYKVWQQQGRQVRKGEKASLKVKIWVAKRTAPRNMTQEDATEEDIQTYYYQKTASLFTKDQTDEK